MPASLVGGKGMEKLAWRGVFSIFFLFNHFLITSF